MKKNTIMLFMLMALLAVVAACAPTGGEPEAAADPTRPAATDTEATDTDEEKTEMEEGTLEGMRWVLVSYLNTAGETVDALAGTEVTAEFGNTTARSMGGNAGCNSYFAGYTVDGANLTISEAGSTMMACEPVEIMQQETEFLAALGSAATFVIEGDQLQIANSAGETVLTFRGTEPAGLTGTNWTAVSYNTGTEAVSSVMADTAITAVFTEDGKMNGSAGCNTYMTSYTLDGNNITIQPPATTRKLCPEPEGIMEQEAAFTTMLPQAETYSISGNSLELRTADGALIASFVPDAAAGGAP